MLIDANFRAAAPSIDFSEDYHYLFKDQGRKFLAPERWGAVHAFPYGSIHAVEIAGVFSRNLARAEAITSRTFRTFAHFLFVAIHQVLPEVSLMPPTRSPQVMSAGSLIGLAPSLTARL
jgi:hypothetical protein